jgi:hypothetical protein
MSPDFKTVTEAELGLHSLYLASSSARSQKYSWNKDYLAALEEQRRGVSGVLHTLDSRHLAYNVVPIQQLQKLRVEPYVKAE